MGEVRSKIHNYGHEHESEWPPQFGERKSGVSYYDKEKGCMVDGYPPNPNPRHGQAPIAIMDSMPPTYHEAAQRTIESRKEWEMADKQHGTITFGSKEQATPKVDQFYKERERKAELRQASTKALQAYKENPQEIKQKLARQTEQQLATLEKAGFDLNNIAKDGVKI
jgi:hypothetical protein